MLRARRLKWAGQILRLEPEDSLVHQVLMAAAMHDLAAGNNRRSLLTDAEEYSTAEEAAGTGSRQEGLGSKGQTNRPSGPQHSSGNGDKLTGCKCRRVEEGGRDT